MSIEIFFKNGMMRVIDYVTCIKYDDEWLIFICDEWFDGAMYCEAKHKIGANQISHWGSLK